MKIGFIYDAAHPWSIGGGEKHLYELARQLVARGHEVHIFCMQYWEGPADLVHDGLHYHAVCPNLPLYGASGKRAIWPAVRFAWGLLLRLPRRGLDELDVVDVLAFPFISVVAFCVVRLLFFRKVPWLLSWLEVWGLRYWRRYLGCRGWVGATIEWLAARLAPVHLCISRLTAGRLHTLLRIPSRKIVVIPRGIELPAGLPHGVAKQQRRVVVVGRLVAYKRVDLVIRAWPTVVQRFPDAELCIIGDGPARPALEKQVQAVGMQESICFRGQLPAREAVLAEIEEASLLALPSEREGQGVVVLEAMALGTAVLVADGCETAAPELLTTEEQRKWCALPHTADGAAWAERIIQLLDDRKRVAQMGDWLGCAVLDRASALFAALVDPQIRGELLDNYRLGLSEDSIARYIRHYRTRRWRTRRRPTPARQCRQRWQRVRWLRWRRRALAQVRQHPWNPRRRPAASCLIGDNLDLERWFRLPKSHERRIHGHRHAGIRIVLEGATLVHARDAHVAHPEPFTVAELLPYRTAKEPPCQTQALQRRKLMRKARSKKKRPLLLADLERRYRETSEF